MNKWYEEAVFYHMYPIGMTGAPRVNDSEEIVHRFGQLNEWLTHISDIGCTAIYIGPLFESTTHGYDTRDYTQVDRRLGDNKDFAEFVKMAHELGIKVVVDGVFNHTGREFFAFQDIQKNRESSPYCKWYKNLHFGGNTPYNDGFYYEAWRGCYELANLNLWETEVRQYLLKVIDGWIEEFDIDGIRLDCADCLEFSFMEEMRRFTEEKKADFWLMGEVIHGDYSRYIGDNMLHSVTNYELHKGLYSGHNDHNYFEIAHTVRREFDENGGIYKGMKLYSFVDNHDVDRIASKLTNKEHLNPVFTLLYTLPGIPSIYYGSEWGIEGRKEGPNDDYLRPEVNIKSVLEDVPNKELMKWVKQLGMLHSEQKALSYGRYRELLLTNRQFGFARFTDEEGVLVAVNNDEQPQEIALQVPDEGKTYTDYITKEELKIENGKISLSMAACSSRVITYNQGEI